MKSNLKFWLVGLVSLTSLCFSFASYAQESKKASLAKPVVLSKVEGLEWVNQIIKQYPEVLWLADANVRKTEEGQSSTNTFYSEQLFGQKFIEFDRTIMTLRCLKLIIDGSEQAYHEFTTDQPAEAKLSKESFLAIHTQFSNVIKSKWGGLSENEIIQALETALVLGDMGKSENARKVFAKYEIDAPDHDDFHQQAIRVLMVLEPELCPSFDRLSPTAKRLVFFSENHGTHFGHLTHLEGGASILEELAKSHLASKDPVALSFGLVVHLADVAGALGHVNRNSSLVYNEQTHKAMQAMINGVNTLSDPKKTKWDAYNTYLATRASWLGLDPNRSEERVLTRIAAMIRLFTPQEGAKLKQAISSLKKEDQLAIADHLDLKEQNEPNRTPTYMPAVLVNLSNNSSLGASKDERLANTVKLGLPFIARVLQKHKEMLASNQIDKDIPLNFNKAAGVAKSSPHLLESEFSIDKEGNVIIKQS